MALDKLVIQLALSHTGKRQEVLLMSLGLSFHICKMGLRMPTL